jgi:murein DD-endopeptidase MepM/ murein hydrolase activator NlpD
MRRGSRTGVVLAAIGLMCGLMCGQVCGTAVAQTVDPSPTTNPATTTTTTTTAPPSTTTTTDPPSSTTTTVSADAAAPPRSDTVQAPTAVEAAAARAAVASLTDGQRALLQRLQRTRDDLAAARATSVEVAVEVAAARSRLDDAQRAAAHAADDASRAAARLVDLHAQTAELASALYQHLNAGVLLETVNTTDRSAVNQVRTYAKAPQSTLDRLVARARAAERAFDDAKSRADAGRAEATAVVGSLQVLADRQRDAVTAAARASDDAQQAVADALGANVALLGQVADPHFGADGITAALLAAEAGDTEPATLVGRFHVPVDAPIGSPYGIRVDPLTGAVGYHPGLDFEAGAGTPVHAPAAGTVVMAGDCGGYGNCVVVDHGDWLGTVSAHLSKVLVTVGQPVTDGEVLGLVGSTGLSTGPHLHFEVRVDGAPIDPLVSLAA